MWGEVLRGLLRRRQIRQPARILLRTPSSIVLAAVPDRGENFTMRAFGNLLVAALIIAGIYYLYVRRFPTASDGTAPTQAILLTAVKSDLLQIAQGERKYMALNSRCASFEELISSRTILMERAAERGGYTYTIEWSRADLTINARHAPSPGDPSIPYPTIQGEQTLQIRQ